MNDSDYAAYDGTGLAQLIAGGEVSPAEVLQAAIARIEAHNGDINAVVLKLYEQAESAVRAPAAGPFSGVPFLLKDLGQYMAGVPTSYGSRLFADSTRPEDSTLVKRYRQAGLIICGKTNTPEMGLATTTEPVLFGATRNPLNRQYSAGGSSGGAAAAVASGMVPMAHASDGGGSIRIPASCCGLVGLKPTRGRVPLGPYGLEGWGGFSTTHAITRSVRDCAALLDISSGEELGAPYYAPLKPRSFRALAERNPEPLRLGLHLSPFSGVPLHPEIKGVTEQAAQACRHLGHSVTPTGAADLDIDPATFKDAHGVIAIAHVAAAIDERLRELGRPLRDDDIEAVTRRNFAAGHDMTAAQYAWAQNRIRKEGLALARYFDRGIDVLITPTMAGLPPRLGELDMMSDDDATYLDILYGMIGFTAIFNDTGLPAISLPLGFSRTGLPIGVQFVAPMGGEGLLLSLAGQLERAGLFQTASAIQQESA